VARRSRRRIQDAALAAGYVHQGQMAIYRPILRWSAADTFEAHRTYGIEPSPLYKQGMSRVGCMSCVNCSKGQLAKITKQFPEHIERIAEWERLVSEFRRGGTSVRFSTGLRPAFPAAGRTSMPLLNGRSRTTRGGRQFDLLSDAEPASACSSVYGLYEWI
jgi:3'-phosphoadenosine 5'-phosphosulfate sulfotransferase (PAPS reductase)/FAD synthetase